MSSEAKRKNGAGHIYEKLANLLINYRFRPGTQLHPNMLANYFNVSSTPVREALHRLGGEQLLIVIPNKGFYSKVLNADEMKELTILIHVLLQHAITSNLQMSHSKRLDDTWSEQMCDPSGCDAEFVERLFKSIASLSNNNSLITLINNLNNRTHYVRVLDLEDETRRYESLLELRELINNINAQSVSDAVINLRRQLQGRLALIPDLVKEGLARCHAGEFLPDGLIPTRAD
jgi:DNA-binding GntR family transcriptional regulator